MAYYGDIRLGDTVDMKFTTRAFATGVPTTLAGTPSVAAYVGNSTTEITAGITLSVDFDSRTGLNNVRVVATGGNGYATATNIDMVITAGTVGGTSVVGEVVCSFSIECRSALMPTTPTLTLDVSAGGEAGLDWANIGSKTTVNALTNTSIITTQKVDVDTIKTNAVVNGGTLTFPSGATLASTTNITAGTITTATNLTNAPTSGDLTSTMKTSVTTAATAATPTAAAVTARVTANTDQLAGQTVTAAAGVTFPASVSSPTNITAGTITTVTNLTNAPTSGDLTATMKTSVTTAATAATPIAASVTGAVGSVAGNVGGNVTGSVASVLAAVAVTGDLSATMKTSVTTAATAATPTAAAVTGNVGGNVTGTVGSVVGAVGSVTGNVGGSVGSVTAAVSIAAGQLFVKKNVTYQYFKFVMTDATTHAPATGLTVTPTRAIDNGAFGACANAVSELAFGWYKTDVAAADFNGTDIALRFTAPGADDKNYKVVTQS